MTYDAAQFASTEMQAILAELERHGVAQDLINKVAARHLAEMERKTNKLQVDVFDIGERIERQVAQIETRLDANLRTQHGDTNRVLADLLAGVRDQGTVVRELRAEFQQIGERVTGIETVINDHALDIASFKRSRQQFVDERQRQNEQIDRLEVSRKENHDAILEVGQQVDRLAQTVQQVLARVTAYDDRSAEAERQQTSDDLLAMLAEWREKRADT